MSSWTIRLGTLSGRPAANDSILPRFNTAARPPQARNTLLEAIEQDKQSRYAYLQSDVTVNGRRFPRAVTIQPHSDDFGDSRYIGSIYGPLKEENSPSGWGIPGPQQQPYLKYVKRVAEQLPYLEYLAHWMQISASPPSWKFLRDHPAHREERACRTHVCVLDFDREHHLAREATYDDWKALKTDLDERPQQNSSSQTRLIIVEDLSRDVVELLGSQYDIDPLFFRSQISDYLFYNTRDPWVELPDLHVTLRHRRHFCLQYLRPRYFNSCEEFDAARLESGLFNVLRRIDGDRSRERLQGSLLNRFGSGVVLTRAKTSVWFKPRTTNEPVLAILLVDPTVKKGYPLWGGHRFFENTPTMNEIDGFKGPPTSNLFDNVVYWSKRLSTDQISQAQTDERCLAIPMYRIVLAEWRTVLKYATTKLSKIEWEFESPYWGKKPNNIEDLLRRLSPWRRNVTFYQSMISDSIDGIFQPSIRTDVAPGHPGTPTPQNEVLSLLYDFRLVQQHMDACYNRIEHIHTVSTNFISIEESRRTMQQNHLARLTFLATIFVPLSFTTSFLSMSSDFASADLTIWLFFAIGMPLTIAALLIADLSNPQGGYIRRWWSNRK